MRPKNNLILPALILAAGIAMAPVAAEAAISGQTVVKGTDTATCPSGYRVTGGGFQIPRDSFGTNSSSEYKVLASGPGSASSWVVDAERISGSYSSSSGWSYTTNHHSVTVRAVCVK